MKLSGLERIFAVTNDGCSKIICFLGIVFKINSFIIYNLKYKFLPIDNNKIVLVNFKGKGFGCNLKYIANEIIRRKLPYQLVWLVNNPNKENGLGVFPDNIKLVNYCSHKGLKELATAKVWIDNQRKIYHIKNGLKKRKGQFYIQTWHGSLGIKKIGVDSPQTEVINDWVPYGIKDSEMIDVILSNSKFENDVFSRNFWGNGNIKMFGHPRNDVFFEKDLKVKTKVFECLGFSEDEKVLLYIPSYRDDGRLYCFGLEYDNLLTALKEKFGGNWKILVRMHPNFVKFQQCLIPQNENIINVSEYPDIQELLVASDIAITDYSSCIFDFMLSRKPGFIYASDIKEYDNDRGFYYPLTSTPFPVAQHNEELRKNILNFNYESYREKVEEFLKDKGCMEDGHASERVVDLIEEIMSKGVK